MDKPKVATFEDIAKNQEIALEQLHLELKKSHPDLELCEKLLWKARHACVPIQGIHNRYKEALEQQTPVLDGLMVTQVDYGHPKGIGKIELYTTAQKLASLPYTKLLNKSFKLVEDDSGKAKQDISKIVSDVTIKVSRPSEGY